jgi:Ca-activated chloride channel homolog
MKTWLVASVAALGLIIGATAQDPPGQGSETVAKPKKKADPNATTDPAATPPSDSGNLPKIPSKLSNKAKEESTGDVSFKADTSVVNVDVAVLDNKGNPIPKIPRDAFRILEDNVPQKLSQYATTQAPLTVALVIEFSARYQQYWSSGWRDTLFASYGFMQTLRPDDYLAVIAYDLRTDILCDFTNDRSKIQEALGRLRIPGFSESNMFDAITETADRMSKIEGRKAILLITSGIDTFSKLTYDKTRKSLQESAVPVYSIGILQIARMMAEARGANDIAFLQGDNELRTFAKETGGQAFFPRFAGEMGSVFQQINQSLRNQYSLGYSPTNQAKDGKFRKITIQLVDPRTNELLSMKDEKGKPFKYSIIAKAGYTAPHAVE